MSKYIVGLDVGYRATGIAFYDATTGRLAFGKSVFTPKKGESIEAVYLPYGKARAPQGWQVENDKVYKTVFSNTLELHRRIFRVLYPFRNDIIAFVLEVPSGGAQSNTAAWAMGISTGVLGGIIDFFQVMHGIPCYPVSNMNVKSVSGKKGKVTKEDMIATASKLYNYDFTQIAKYRAEHIADALCAVHFALNNIADLTKYKRKTS